MAGGTTKVVIPFRPLLQQITECLNCDPPKYRILDEPRNNVAISIGGPNGSATYAYVSGPSPTVGESCEKAARQATIDLMAKFNVVVKDVTSSKNAEFERCTALYKLKYDELDLVENGLAKTTLYEEQEKIEPTHSKIVELDYMSVLRDICLQLDLKGTYVDTVEHDPSHFTSFTIVNRPGCTKTGKCIVGDSCSTLPKAKNNMDEKVVGHLIAIYNLEIVNANYNSRKARLVPVTCALQRESFRTIREMVIGIKEEVEDSCLLVEGDCNTPRASAYQIPTLTGPRLAPRKRRCQVPGNAGSIVPESQNRVPVYFRVPEPLQTLLCCPKPAQ